MLDEAVIRRQCLGGLCTKLHHKGPIGPEGQLRLSMDDPWHSDVGAWHFLVVIFITEIWN
jgi:hypothetical protein